MLFLLSLQHSMSIQSRYIVNFCFCINSSVYPLSLNLLPIDSAWDNKSTSFVQFLFNEYHLSCRDIVQPGFKMATL